MRLTHKLLEQAVGPELAIRLIRQFGNHRLPSTGAEIIERNQRIKADFDQCGDYEIVARRSGIGRSRVVQICAE